MPAYWSRLDIANCSFTADADHQATGVTDTPTRILSLLLVVLATPKLPNPSDSPLSLPTFAGALLWMPDRPQ